MKRIARSYFGRNLASQTEVRVRSRSEKTSPVFNGHFINDPIRFDHRKRNRAEIHAEHKCDNYVLAISHISTYHPIANRIPLNHAGPLLTPLIILRPHGSPSSRVAPHTVLLLQATTKFRCNAGCRTFASIPSSILPHALAVAPHNILLCRNSQFEIRLLSKCCSSIRKRICSSSRLGIAKA
jgi:hypothetical protein